MDLYREEVMDHYEHPRNQGELQGKDVLSEKVSNASCGDMIQFYIRIVKSSDHSPRTAPACAGRQGSELIIAEVKWRGVGCAITTAAASKLSEYLQGQALKDIQKMSEEELAAKGVGFEVNAGRTKCLMLPIKAVKKLLSASEPLLKK